MSVYDAPEGYLYDPDTGLYYSQVLATDDGGNLTQVVTWFYPDTGEYEQHTYPVNSGQSSGRRGKPGDQRDNRTGNRTRNRTQKILLSIMITVIVLATAITLLVGWRSFGWFAKSDASDDQAVNAVDEEAADPSEETDVSDLISIYNHNDKRVSFVFFAKQLEGIDGLNHVAFNIGDHSVSVDDWDNEGNLSQCSIWVRDRENKENVSYKVVDEAKYSISEDQIITIDADFTNIPEVDPYNMTAPCSFHVEYLNGGNYTYDFSYNAIALYDGEDGSAENAETAEQSPYSEEEGEEIARYLLSHQGSVKINSGETYHYEDYSDNTGEFWLYRYSFDFDPDGNIVWANGTYISLENIIELKTGPDHREQETVDINGVEMLGYSMIGDSTAAVRFMIKGYLIRLEVNFDEQKAHAYLEGEDSMADTGSLFAHIDGGEAEFRTPEEIEEVVDRAKAEGWYGWWQEEN